MSLIAARVDPTIEEIDAVVREAEEILALAELDGLIRTLDRVATTVDGVPAHGDARLVPVDRDRPVHVGTRTSTPGAWARSPPRPALH